MVRMPQIDNRVSFGNILTIVALLVPAVMAWATLTAQARQHDNILVDHEARLRVIETKIGESLARIDQRLTQIEGRLATEDGIK